MGVDLFFQFFVPNICTNKEAQCTSYLPLNKKVTCDFVFSFTIYKSWKSYFRIFQNVCYVQMFGNKVQVLWLLIFFQKILQEDDRQLHEQTKAIWWIQIWSGLFKVGNIFVFFLRVIVYHRLVQKDIHHPQVLLMKMGVVYGYSTTNLFNTMFYFLMIF